MLLSLYWKQQDAVSGQLSVSTFSPGGSEWALTVKGT